MKAVLSFLLIISVLFTTHAQQYQPVDDKSEINFAIKNFGINTNGEFKGLKGIIKWDASNPSASVFNVTVDANTINTDIDMRKSSSGSVRSPHDTQLHYLLRIRARYVLQGGPPAWSR